MADEENEVITTLSGLRRNWNNWRNQFPQSHEHTFAEALGWFSCWILSTELDKNPERFSFPWSVGLSVSRAIISVILGLYFAKNSFSEETRRLCATLEFYFYGALCGFLVALCLKADVGMGPDMTFLWSAVSVNNLYVLCKHTYERSLPPSAEPKDFFDVTTFHGYAQSLCMNMSGFLIRGLYQQLPVDTFFIAKVIGLVGLLGLFGFRIIGTITEGTSRRRTLFAYHIFTWILALSMPVILAMAWNTNRFIILYTTSAGLGFFYLRGIVGEELRRLDSSQQ